MGMAILIILGILVAVVMLMFATTAYLLLKQSKDNKFYGRAKKSNIRLIDDVQLDIYEDIENSIVDGFSASNS